MAKSGKAKKTKTPARKAAKKRRAARHAEKLAPLFTIGYEQAKLAAVLDELKHAKVDTLVDVRAVAASRRPGFSKRQLAAALDQAGIDYLHLQKLGTPAEGRQAARAGDRDTLMRVYDTHMQKPEPQAEFSELVSLIRSGKRIALLCYCRDPKTCHRSSIVKRVQARLPLQVQNLIPPLF